MSQSLDRTRQLILDRARRTQSQHRRTILLTAPARAMTLCVTGGNAAQIGGGVEGIQYAASLTLTQAYDPATDTVYPPGLGRGVLFVNGIQQSAPVLIRHNYLAMSYPVLQGMMLRSPATTTMTYDPGGGGDVVTMTAYLFDWC